MKIKYIDKRQMFIAPGTLKSYPQGVAVPFKSGETILEASDGEFKSLSVVKNGKYDCWVKLNDRSNRNVIKEESMPLGVEGE